MQRADHDNFEDRCIFYLSRLIHQQKLKSNRHWEIKMKEENFDLAKIAGFTALSFEEIESL